MSNSKDQQFLVDLGIVPSVMKDSPLGDVGKWLFALEALGDGFWELNFKTEICTLSPRMLEILGGNIGIDSNTLTFKKLLESMRPETVAARTAAMQAILDKKTDCYVIEEQVRSKNGRYIWLLSRGVVMRCDATGKPLLMIGTSSDISARKQTEEALKNANARYQRLIENAGKDYNFFAMNAEGILTYVSPSIEEMMGWTQEEYLGHYNKTLSNSPINAIANKLTEAGLRGEKQLPYLIEDTHKDGSTRLIEVSETPIFDETGVVIGLEGVSHDITERMQAEAKLKLAASVFTHAREGIIITDAQGNIIEVNATFSEISGFSRSEAIGQNPRIMKSNRQDAGFFEAVFTSLHDNSYWRGEIWNLHKNGNEYLISMTISAVRNAAGETQSYVSLFTDITEVKAQQEQLEYIAHFDVLTKLPNRVFLADRLSQAMLQCHRFNQLVGVAFLDLDGFKTINDLYGHDVGDELLVQITERMKSSLRESDTLARIGGDEFVVVLTGLDSAIHCEPPLERLLKATSSAVEINGITIEVSASIGVTLYPFDDGDADQLVRHADQAMYAAKQAGKNRYHMFDVAQDAAIKTQRETTTNIATALNNQEFALYYQPKVNMRTGEIIGVEALIRWQHPDKGLLPPSAFLPTIETHPLSIKMGEWVINTALAQMSAWQQVGIKLKISVNIGANQLQDKNFASNLGTILAAYPDVNPQKLELEIVETSALEEIDQVSQLMLACQALGVSFALDDFGTGYSSLTYLKRLPADTLKIDQSFVRDMIEDPDDLTIVKGVVSLAQAFHRAVIAEGVETIAHGTLLLGLGCELAQGYGIARPMPAENVPEWVKTWQPDKKWASNNYELAFD